MLWILVPIAFAADPTVQAHLLNIESELRKAPVDDLDPSAAARRSALLYTLDAYAHAGEYPHGDGTLRPLPPGSEPWLFDHPLSPGAAPIFVDDAGRYCAVGWLLHMDGQDSLVSTVVERDRYARVYEIDAWGPELSAWANSAGFTVDELARIQPTYPIMDFPPPSPFCIAEGIPPEPDPAWAGSAPPGPARAAQEPYKAWYDCMDAIVVDMDRPLDERRAASRAMVQVQAGPMRPGPRIAAQTSTGQAVTVDQTWWSALRHLREFDPADLDALRQLCVWSGQDWARQFDTEVAKVAGAALQDLGGAPDRIQRCTQAIHDSTVLHSPEPSPQQPPGTAPTVPASTATPESSD